MCQLKYVGGEGPGGPGRVGGLILGDEFIFGDRHDVPSLSNEGRAVVKYAEILGGQGRAIQVEDVQAEAAWSGIRSCVLPAARNFPDRYHQGDYKMRLID